LGDAHREREREREGNANFFLVSANFVCAICSFSLKVLCWTAADFVFCFFFGFVCCVCVCERERERDASQYAAVVVTRVGDHPGES
jgi:hypothetical protein